MVMRFRELLRYSFCLHLHEISRQLHVYRPQILDLQVEVHLVLRDLLCDISIDLLLVKLAFAPE